jgi:antitoxin CcdA
MPPTTPAASCSVPGTARKSTNVPQVAEAGLACAIAEKRAELWLAANREALDSSNAFVENNGLPLAHHRKF